MEYTINELKDISFMLCETPFNYNMSLKEKDKSFKVLFEVKEQFIQLLKTFVKEKWVDVVNVNNIELVDKEFTTIYLEERRADVIYKINLNDREIYFFLLEVQSYVDKMMPFRLYEYMLELYRRYSNRKINKLPIVIPCVLYTGNSKWNVGTMKSLFNVRSEIERYIPEFEYILLDVNNYTDDELLEISNLISSVFFLSKANEGKDVIKRIDELLKTIKQLNKDEQKSLTKWAKTMFIKKPEVSDYMINNFEGEEDNNMAFAEAISEAIEIWKQEGRNEGYSKAKLSSIIRILSKKLNLEPTKKIISKLESLSLEELDNIEDRIFEIESWEEI